MLKNDCTGSTDIIHNIHLIKGCLIHAPTIVTSHADKCLFSSVSNLHKGSRSLIVSCQIFKKKKYLFPAELFNRLMTLGLSITEYVLIDHVFAANEQQCHVYEPVGGRG